MDGVGVGVGVFRSMGSQTSVSNGGGDDIGVEPTLGVDVIEGDRPCDETESFLGLDVNLWDVGAVLNRQGSGSDFQGSGIGIVAWLLEDSIPPHGSSAKQ